MSVPTTVRYLEPTQEAGRLFVQRGLEGSVVMLNLLRFGKVADYMAHPQPMPASSSSAQAVPS